MHPIRFSVAAALLAASTLLPTAVRAAEGYGNCSGFIDAIPATVSTPGVWCLRQNLSTAMTDGAAITIATDNVTLDCNDFKLGGLAAGDHSMTSGIYADGRQGVTVRHCGVRGFLTGINLVGGGKHLIEDNRLDQNLASGILVTGSHSLVRRNRVLDTGGYYGSSTSTGIDVVGDVLDNVVDGVFSVNANSVVNGIFVRGAGSEAGRNAVRDLVATGSGFAKGIWAFDGGITIADNHVVAPSSMPGSGIGGGVGATDRMCLRNSVSNFASNLSCHHSYGNLAGQ